MWPVNLGKQVNLVVVTAVQRCRSFVADGHAGIEQTSAIVEGEDSNFCACSSCGWRLTASVGCMCSCVLSSITGRIATRCLQEVGEGSTILEGGRKIMGIWSRDR